MSEKKPHRDQGLTMGQGNHDTLVYRLSQMLVKLNQGEYLDPKLLAEEFGVALRTVQRDLNVRFAYLPLIKTDGRYHLDVTFLGKINLQDVKQFASLAGIRGLFPSLTDTFLREIFDGRIQSSLLIKGFQYEDLNGKEIPFRELENAIVSRRLVNFDYLRDGKAQHYKDVQPYRLINNKGIWYLAGVDDGKIKTFSFTKIDALRTLDTLFEPNAEINEKLESDDGVWFASDPKEIVLQVSPEAAGYFRRRKLIANQVIEKELEDGGLILSAKVGHENQVIPIVRYWIPHIRVINPVALQKQIESQLTAYMTQK